MAIPKYNDLYREILVSISDGIEHPSADIRDSVAKQKRLTSDERAVMFNKYQSTFDYRVAWARTYLKAAGLIVYPKRGFTQITDEGRKVLADTKAVINNDYLRRYKSFCAFISNSVQNTKTSNKAEDATQISETPHERIDVAFSEIHASLCDELLTEIMNQAPAFFEGLVVQLLVKMGYGGSAGDNAGQVTKLSSDEGIDGIIREDKLGFSNIFIQAKRWDIKRTVNRPDIQAFVGAIANKAGKGLFISTATFSEGAQKCAKENHVVLIDGNRLAALMIEHGVGVSTTQTYEIKKIDSDFFSE